MAETEEEVVVKSKSTNIVLIMVIVLLLVILIMGSAVIWLLASGPSDEAAAAPAETSAVESKQASKPEKKKDANNAEMGTIYPLESFTVNLASEGGTKYLKTTIQLEQNIPELTAELDKKRPLIIDAIISTLSSKSFEEISTNRGKKRLKEELMEKINYNLNDGFIKNIYITEFVVS